MPLRLGAAFALVPWVDENIVKKFGVGAGDDDDDVDGDEASQQ